MKFIDRKRRKFTSEQGRNEGMGRKGETEGSHFRQREIHVQRNNTVMRIVEDVW